MRLLPVILMFFAVADVVAQEDPCTCNAVLMDGVYAYRKVTQNDDAKLDIRAYVQNKSYDEFRKESSGDGGAKWGGFGFNANMNKAEFNAHQSRLIHENDVRSRNIGLKAMLDKHGDVNVLTAWSSCKANCKAPGFRTSFFLRDSKIATLHLKWTPPADWVGAIRLEDSEVRNGSVHGAPKGKLSKGEDFSFESERIYVIERENLGEPVSVWVRLGTRDVYEYIPVVKDPLGASSGACTPSQGKILIRACDGRNTGEIAQILNANPACLNYQDHIGQSCVYIAGNNCDEPTVRLLLDKNANINLQIRPGYQPTKEYPSGRYTGWTALSALRHRYVVERQGPKPNMKVAGECVSVEKLLLPHGALDSAIYRTVPIGRISR